MLTNRFYLDEIPNGDDGWLPGKHEPFIERVLWDRVQLARKRNRTSTRSRTPGNKRVTRLTGITYCWYCKGRIHSLNNSRGQPRLGCYTRAKRRTCKQISALLSVYEHHIAERIKSFRIPADCRVRTLDYYCTIEDEFEDTSAEKQRL